MNPPLDFADAGTQLAILTSQTGNFTFDTDEMTQALTTAWNDDFNVVTVWDSSLSYTDGTWSYDIPATVDVVRDLYFTRTTTDNIERLSPNIYEIVDGDILFNPKASQWLITGMTIYIKGVKKLTTSDSLGSTQLINYVLYTAATILLNQLVLKQAFVFLRNDISMSDIARALNIVQSQAIRYKQTILREFESA